MNLGGSKLLFFIVSLLHGSIKAAARRYQTAVGEQTHRKSSLKVKLIYSVPDRICVVLLKWLWLWFIHSAFLSFFIAQFHFMMINFRVMHIWALIDSSWGCARTRNSLRCKWAQSSSDKKSDKSFVSLTQHASHKTLGSINCERLFPSTRELFSWHRFSEVLGKSEASGRK